MQFFDRLIMLMAKKPDLPDKIFTIKESLEVVKELSGFFLASYRLYKAG